MVCLTGTAQPLMYLKGASHDSIQINLTTQKLLKSMTKNTV